MKKAIALLLAVVMLLSLVACGKTEPSGNISNTEQPNQYSYDSGSLESILAFIKTTGEAAATDTTNQAETLIEKLGDSYSTYNANKADVTVFFESAQTRSTELYAKFQACSIDYFKCVAKQGLEDYSAWDDAMGEFYDTWDDAMGDYYDAWNEAYGDIYDICDDLISAASDELEYGEYSDAWSAMYNEYSDAWSTMYKAYSDAWSKTYSDYSSVWSGFYSGKTDVDIILAATEKDDEQDDNEDGNKETTDDADSLSSASYSDIKSKIETEVETTLSALTAEWETLSADIDSYGTYMAKAAEMKAFYEKVNSTSASLCLKMCSYSMEYAEAILASGRSTDDMYSDMSELYDVIYDEACGDIYDGIYDGLLDDMYDVLYDGALKDRPDGVEYKDWSEPRSNEYKQWSDTRSDAYEQWSDARSDIYDFWSDLRSELWGDDIDGAEEEVADFRKYIEKQAGKVDSDTTAPSETTDTTTGEIRADFKAAMDSYEKFFDEYVAIMKKFKENPTDMSILADYTKYMGQYADMMQKMEDWENEDLNAAELAYYLEVQNRITQKLLEIA